MTDRTAQPYAAFRLNLEQQQKRAKELLKAAKAGDAAALERLQRQIERFDTGALKLALTQHCLARELRFASWAALKRHIAAMDGARATLGEAALDADRRTLHIRCGDDFVNELREAGLHGDFGLYINPFLQGPVTDTPDWLERRARFIAESVGPDMNLDYESVLERCRDEERRLADASREYERVVLWLEHDRYDQFVLLRCLACFAEHGAPARLELVGPNDFPGATRFVGLGQLPPEALRLLWQRRAPVSTEQLRFGREVWTAFRSPDPRRLAEHVRNGTPPLPDLARALHRHLQELPSLRNGLGLTQQLLLATLAEHDAMPAGLLVGQVVQADPLPGLGDAGYVWELRQLEAAAEPPLLRTAAGAPSTWRDDRLTLMQRGRELLAGSRNWLDSPVPERWVGGVSIAAGRRNWHWDERTRDVVMR